MFLYVRVYSRLKGSPLAGKKKWSIPANIFQNSCLCLRCVFQTNHLYSDAVFSPSLIVNLFFTQDNKRKYTSIEYSRCPRYSRFFATPFAGISGLGIICGPIWESFAELGLFAGPYRSGALATMKICVLWGWWFANQFEIESETSLNHWYSWLWAGVSSLLCPETDWNIRIGKQGYAVYFKWF